ncbi:MAG: hypothetical protein JOS17DRAFT_766323 [Linnemannia elongata]|nr:MAG: hypothetical protein JOS17DRAFT_766323 [Linnemannia elongata]
MYVVVQTQRSLGVISFRRSSYLLQTVSLSLSLSLIRQSIHWRKVVFIFAMLLGCMLTSQRPCLLSFDPLLVPYHFCPLLARLCRHLPSASTGTPFCDTLERSVRTSNASSRKSTVGRHVFWAFGSTPAEKKKKNSISCLSVSADYRIGTSVLPEKMRRRRQMIACHACVYVCAG